MMRLRLKGDYIPEFLELVLRHSSVRRRITAIAQGTSESMVKISGLALGSLLIPQIPLTLQRRIMAFLDNVSEMERAIDASIQKLRAVRLGVQLSLLSATDARRAPAVSWSRALLRDVVPPVEYGISEALVNDPAGVPVLRMNNLQDGRPDVTELRYCPVSIPQGLYLKRGDVLFNRTNSIDHVGKAAIWREELPVASFASYLVRLNPDRRKLLPDYLVEWLQHPVTRQRVRAIATVAVQQVNVNPTRLRELEIDFPDDLTEQRRIVSTLASFDDRIAREMEEMAKLRRLKRGLTDDLLSGKVHVPDAA
ncbi:restriction endonuclease subunit S [Streptomyces sp. JL3001]|uniref:restriction endonuclease subunit S n=1 Tax=Streptomyces sp. JL3001 TaxID=3400923 RepID=UPI003B280AE9